MARGLIAHKHYDIDLETITASISTADLGHGAGKTMISVGLFNAGHEGRLVTTTGSGIPGDTWIDTIVDANTAVLNQAATATGSRTVTIDGLVVLAPNQGTLDPVAFKLDPANLVLDPFDSGSTGLVQLVMCATIKAYPASSADNYLEAALVDSADDVLLPSTPGGVGRRVNLSDAKLHRFKLDLELALLPNTTYPDAAFAVAGGNQIEGTGGDGTRGYMIIIGGSYGAATIEVWDLDDGTGPRLITLPVGLVTFAGLPLTLSLGTAPVALPAGHIALAGLAPVFGASATLPLPAGLVLFAGVAPSIGAGGTPISLPAGQITLAGTPLTFSGASQVPLPAGQITLAGAALTMAAGIATMALPAGRIDFAGLALGLYDPDVTTVFIGSMTVRHHD